MPVPVPGPGAMPITPSIPIIPLQNTVEYKRKLSTPPIPHHIIISAATATTTTTLTTTTTTPVPATIKATAPDSVITQKDSSKPSMMKPVSVQIHPSQSSSTTASLDTSISSNNSSSTKTLLATDHTQKQQPVDRSDFRPTLNSPIAIKSESSAIDELAETSARSGLLSKSPSLKKVSQLSTLQIPVNIPHAFSSVSPIISHPPWSDTPFLYPTTPATSTSISSIRPTPSDKDQEIILEQSFCKDFLCCGLILDDLHHLITHVEECHSSIPFSQDDDDDEEEEEDDEDDVADGDNSKDVKVCERKIQMDACDLESSEEGYSRDQDIGFIIASPVPTLADPSEAVTASLLNNPSRKNLDSNPSHFLSKQHLQCKFKNRNTFFSSSSSASSISSTTSNCSGSSTSSHHKQHRWISSSPPTKRVISPEGSSVGTAVDCIMSRSASPQHILPKDLVERDSSGDEVLKGRGFDGIVGFREGRCESVLIDDLDLGMSELMCDSASVYLVKSPEFPMAEYMDLGQDPILGQHVAIDLLEENHDMNGKSHLQFGMDPLLSSTSTIVSDSIILPTHATDDIHSLSSSSIHIIADPSSKPSPPQPQSTPASTITQTDPLILTSANINLDMDMDMDMHFLFHHPMHQQQHQNGSTHIHHHPLQPSPLAVSLSDIYRESTDAPGSPDSDSGCYPLSNSPTAWSSEGCEGQECDEEDDIMGLYRYHCQLIEDGAEDDDDDDDGDCEDDECEDDNENENHRYRRRSGFYYDVDGSLNQGIKGYDDEEEEHVDEEEGPGAGDCMEEEEIDIEGIEPDVSVLPIYSPCDTPLSIIRKKSKMNVSSHLKSTASTPHTSTSSRSSSSSKSKSKKKSKSKSKSSSCSSSPSSASISASSARKKSSLSSVVNSPCVSSACPTETLTKATKKMRITYSASCLDHVSTTASSPVLSSPLALASSLKHKSKSSSQKNGVLDTSVVASSKSDMDDFRVIDVDADGDGDGDIDIEDLSHSLQKTTTLSHNEPSVKTSSLLTKHLKNNGTGSTTASSITKISIKLKADPSLKITTPSATPKNTPKNTPSSSATNGNARRASSTTASNSNSASKSSTTPPPTPPTTKHTSKKALAAAASAARIAANAHLSLADQVLLALPKPTGPQLQRLKLGSLSIIDPATGDKKFFCPCCSKEYKNANGLKYHLLHSHADGVGMPPGFYFGTRPGRKKIRDPSAGGEDGSGGESEYEDYEDEEEEDETVRPFACVVEGCEKRYKNLNGLKYHVEHTHMDILPKGAHMAAAAAMKKNGVVLKKSGSGAASSNATSGAAASSGRNDVKEDQPAPPPPSSSSSSARKKGESGTTDTSTSSRHKKETEKSKAVERVKKEVEYVDDDIDVYEGEEDDGRDEDYIVQERKRKTKKSTVEKIKPANISLENVLEVGSQRRASGRLGRR